MKRTAVLLSSLALLIPGAAVASANPVGSSYDSNTTGHTVDNASASRSPQSSQTSPATSATSPTAVQDSTATQTESTGSLPFTGLDIGGLAGGAVVLLGSGLMLRRASSKSRR